MKPAILIVLSFFLFAFIAGNHKNDLEEKNLKGKVKAMIETGYSVKNIPLQPQKDSICYNYISTFDSNGNYLEFKSCIKKDTSTIRYVLKYDNDRNVTELVQYENNKLAVRRSFKYDSLGNIVEEKAYDTNNLFFGRDVYKYDKLGNQIKRKEYIGYIQEKGKITRFDTGGNLMHEYTYQYDEKGNKVAETENYPDGSLTAKYTYKYDVKGNMTEYHDLNRKGNHRDDRTYQYFSFDNQGNWQKEIYSNNGKPIVIIERQIEYY